jgi:hypothetical protein
MKYTSFIYIYTEIRFNQTKQAWIRAEGAKDNENYRVYILPKLYSKR